MIGQPIPADGRSADRARIGKGRAVHLIANGGTYCGALIRAGHTPVGDAATCLNCRKVERAVVEGRAFVPPREPS